jgi:hypothetical protein
VDLHLPRLAKRRVSSSASEANATTLAAEALRPMRRHSLEVRQGRQPCPTPSFKAALVQTLAEARMKALSESLERIRLIFWAAVSGWAYELSTDYTGLTAITYRAGATVAFFIALVYAISIARRRTASLVAFTYQGESDE